MGKFYRNVRTLKKNELLIELRDYSIQLALSEYDLEQAIYLNHSSALLKQLEAICFEYLTIKKELLQELSNRGAVSSSAI